MRIVSTVSQKLTPEPAISEEEFDDDTTYGFSDFNVLKEMFRELKDKFEALKMEKTSGTMSQQSSEASEQMMDLQSWSSPISTTWCQERS